MKDLIFKNTQRKTEEHRSIENLKYAGKKGDKQYASIKEHSINRIKIQATYIYYSYMNEYRYTHTQAVLYSYQKYV